MELRHAPTGTHSLPSLEVSINDNLSLVSLRVNLARTQTPLAVPLLHHELEALI